MPVHICSKQNKGSPIGFQGKEDTHCIECGEELADRSKLNPEQLKFVESMDKAIHGDDLKPKPLVPYCVSCGTTPDKVPHFCTRYVVHTKTLGRLGDGVVIWAQDELDAARTVAQEYFERYVEPESDTRCFDEDFEVNHFADTTKVRVYSTVKMVAELIEE